MNAEGFTETNDNTRTPNNMNVTEKPSKNDPTKTSRVDINVLKARVQNIQDKENKKNIAIFIFFVIVLGAIGAYLSI
jgi:hypothetical protein